MRNTEATATSDTVNPFVHLRVHSAYSLLEGAIQIPKLTELCRANHMPAVAVTDSANLYGALEFSSTLSMQGIQPIVGCAVGVVSEQKHIARYQNSGLRPPALVLLAQSEDGYQNLIRLVSKTFDDTNGHHPYAMLSDLGECAEDLICLTGGPYGMVGENLRNLGLKRTRTMVRELKEMFPDRLYIELQRHGSGDGSAGGGKHVKLEAATEPLFLQLALDPELQLPIVATNEVYFPNREFFDAHDALLGISPNTIGVPRDGRITPEHYFKSGADMRQLFADLPEAADNTVEIAMRCWYWPHRSDPILPKFANDEIQKLRDEAHAGLSQRFEQVELAVAEEDYRTRLDYELKVICDMKFAGYFLIVADFVNWAKDHEPPIPVGPGRGSGAGSLVAYALRITDVDPMRYGLLFERFLNPERISMPDFDIDFCEHQRDQVLQYVRHRWGDDRVAKIITFGSMQARAVVRDVGRALGVSRVVCDRIAKTIPYNPANPVSLPEAKKSIPEFREEIEREQSTQRLFEIAAQLEGLPRNASIHAAGIVIGDRPLNEMVPLCKEAKTDYPATQFAMGWAEAAGLVKFDFLGLKTLTAMQETVNQVAARGETLDLSTIPLNDAKVFELLSRADTAGVFQVEGEGMRDVLRQLQPDRVEDIIALVALYRPGPMDNIPDYCDIKNGKKQVSYLHPKLEPILSETYGIIVYQEQVMEIARQLAGYSLGQADMLRRAMGKKKPEEMKAMRSTFLAGLREHSDLKGKDAEAMFDLVAKFAEYGFNKSHAAAYALISYQTAYLKVHYPAEFLAAIMNTEMNGQDRDTKLAMLRDEARGLNVAAPPPCINRSFARFQAVHRTDSDGPPEVEIPYALGAIKGVSVHTVKSIADAREQDGPFTSLGDFARRVELKEIGKKALEGLAKAGAFDAVEPNRRRVLQSVSVLQQYSEDHHGGGGAGESLFDTDELATGEPVIPEIAEFKPVERYAEERAAIGFLISGHPLDDHVDDLRARNIKLCSQLVQAGNRGEGELVVGVVDAVTRRRSQRGKTYAQITASDPYQSCSMVMFGDELANYGNQIETGSVLAFTVDVEDDARGRSLICKRVRPIAEVLQAIKPARVRPSTPPPADGPPHPSPQEPQRAEIRRGVTQNVVTVRIRLAGAAARTAPQAVMHVLKSVTTNGGSHATASIAFEIGAVNGSPGTIGHVPETFQISPEVLTQIQQIPGVHSVQQARENVH